nr:hypothetical protein [Tanacetum cinerariifolium]
MNQNQIGRTIFDIDEESDAFYFQKAIEYHEWLLQQEAQPRLTRTPIFRDREDAERLMSADFAVTYSSVHSEARSWSIQFEDPYEEAAQQLFEQAPHSPELGVLDGLDGTERGYQGR